MINIFFNINWIIVWILAEKLPADQVEEVIKSTETVEDDEGMIKYDGIIRFRNYFLWSYFLLFNIYFSFRQKNYGWSFPTINTKSITLKLQY